MGWMGSSLAVECLVGMVLSLMFPYLADPERGQVTRLEAEATIPPVASPSQPILVVSLQEEQDKCKGTLEVSAAEECLGTE